MTLLEKFIAAKKPATGGTPENPKWARTEKGCFRRLLALDPEDLGLSEKSGVIVVWHGGMRPKWVFAGATRDMATTFHEIAENPAYTDYEAKGGLFVTWATIREEFQGGVVKFLNETMTPLIENPAVAGIEGDPIPVILPGQEKTRI